MRPLLYFLAADLVAVALAGCSGDLPDPLGPEDATVLLSIDCNPNAKGGRGWSHRLALPRRRRP
jgi:hypothetical protein